MTRYNKMGPKKEPVNNSDTESETESEDDFSEILTDTESEVASEPESVNSLSDEERESIDEEASDVEEEKINDESEYNDEDNIASELEFKEVTKEDECVFNTIKRNDKESVNKKVPDNERMTSKKITKYELVRILGDRAKQISLNAKIMIKDITITNPIDIAIEELKAGVLPLKIRRHLPDGSYEEWKLSELEFDL